MTCGFESSCSIFVIRSNGIRVQYCALRRYARHAPSASSRAATTVGRLKDVSDVASLTHWTPSFGSWRSNSLTNNASATSEFKTTSVNARSSSAPSKDAIAATKRSETSEQRFGQAISSRTNATTSSRERRPEPSASTRLKIEPMVPRSARSIAAWFDDRHCFTDDQSAGSALASTSSRNACLSTFNSARYRFAARSNRAATANAP
mmetsp:Transcript_23669/g.73127  ORF Transcript_23669/g.73127 Transcript_23669/m.73127 type:complete len:206 (+) Transcript_23669:263-880(+)